MRKVNQNNADALKIKELKPVSSYLSTGCTILDLAVSDTFPGGFGAGRISHIYGPESSAKSILISEPLGSAIRQQGNAYLCDVEGTFDFGRAELFGVNTKELKYISSYSEDAPDEITVEYLFDECIRKAEEEVKGLKAPSAFGVDSLSAVSSEKEMDDNDPYGASKAKMLSAKFRQHIWKINSLNLALIFVDQTRQNVGGFGKKFIFGGGEALKFYASTRLYVEKKGDIVNKHKRKTGIEVFFRVEKNKIAPPFREGSFMLLFDYGIDNIATNLIFLKENSEEKGNRYKIPGIDKSYYLNDAIKYIEDTNIEDKLNMAVYEKWQELYVNVNRKRRIR